MRQHATVSTLFRAADPDPAPMAGPGAAGKAGTSVKATIQTKPTSLPVGQSTGFIPAPAAASSIEQLGIPAPFTPIVPIPSLVTPLLPPAEPVVQAASEEGEIATWRRLQDISKRHEAKRAQEQAARAEKPTAAHPTADVMRAIEAAEAAPTPLQDAWPVEKSELPPHQEKAADTSTSPPPVQPTAPADPAQVKKIQTKLDEVTAARPTDSSIELHLPRRPRPKPPAPPKPEPVKSKLPFGKSAQRSPEPSKSEPPAPPRMVPTEIGPLPADLWEHLGETPPRSEEAPAGASTTGLEAQESGVETQPAAPSETTAGGDAIQRAIAAAEAPEPQVPAELGAAAPTLVSEKPIEPQEKRMAPSASAASAPEIQRRIVESSGPKPPEPASKDIMGPTTAAPPAGGDDVIAPTGASPEEGAFQHANMIQREDAPQHAEIPQAEEALQRAIDAAEAHTAPSEERTATPSVPAASVEKSAPESSPPAAQRAEMPAGAVPDAGQRRAPGEESSASFERTPPTAAPPVTAEVDQPEAGDDMAATITPAEIPSPTDAIQRAIAAAESPEKQFPPAPAKTPAASGATAADDSPRTVQRSPEPVTQTESSTEFGMTAGSTEPLEPPPALPSAPDSAPSDEVVEADTFVSGDVQREDAVQRAIAAAEAPSEKPEMGTAAPPDTTTATSAPAQRQEAPDEPAAVSSPDISPVGAPTSVDTRVDASGGQVDTIDRADTIQRAIEAAEAPPAIQSPDAGEPVKTEGPAEAPTSAPQGQPEPPSSQVEPQVETTAAPPAASDTTATLQRAIAAAEAPPTPASTPGMPALPIPAAAGQTVQPTKVRLSSPSPPPPSSSPTLPGKPTAPRGSAARAITPDAPRTVSVLRSPDMTQRADEIQRADTVQRAIAAAEAPAGAPQVPSWIPGRGTSVQRQLQRPPDAAPRSEPGAGLETLSADVWQISRSSLPAPATFPSPTAAPTLQRTDTLQRANVLQNANAVRRAIGAAEAPPEPKAAPAASVAAKPETAELQRAPADGSTNGFSPLVQRVIEITELETTATDVQEDLLEGKTGEAEIDVGRLARLVYSQIRRRLALEW